MILNQWHNPDCAAYAILAVIIKRRPDIDVSRVIEAITQDSWSALTLGKASLFFKKMWLIKWIEPCRYPSPRSIKNNPIVFRIFNIDWIKTGTSPYNIEYNQIPKNNAHFVMCDQHWIITNSWGDNWGYKWKCYFNKKDICKFSQIYRVIF